MPSVGWNTHHGLVAAEISALVFNDVYWGFFVVAGVLFLLAGIAAFLAIRWFKGGAPPAPTMAIDEAQRIRQTLSGEPGGQLEAVQARDEAGGSVPSPEGVKDGGSDDA